MRPTEERLREARRPVAPECLELPPSPRVLNGPAQPFACRRMLAIHPNRALANRVIDGFFANPDSRTGILEAAGKLPKFEEEESQAGR
jgi:hypothetical protein